LHSSHNLWSNACKLWPDACKLWPDAFTLWPDAFTLHVACHPKRAVLVRLLEPHLSLPFATPGVALTRAGSLRSCRPRLANKKRRMLWAGSSARSRAGRAASTGALSPAPLAATLN
jgi:hypothetical protein